MVLNSFQDGVKVLIPLTCVCVGAICLQQPEQLSIHGVRVNAICPAMVLNSFQDGVKVLIPGQKEEGEANKPDIK